MNVTFSTQDIFQQKADGIVLFTYEGRSPAEARWQGKLGKSLSLAREHKEFSGKKGELFLDRQEERPRFVLMAGLGKKEDFSAVRVRESAGAAALCLRDLGAKAIAIEVPTEGDAQEIGQAVTEGVLLSTYQFRRYKTKKDDVKELEALAVVSDRTGVGVKQGIDVGRTIAESVNMARDLQNTPSSDLTPAIFADHAVKMAKKERLKVKVLERKALEKQGYGGILAVGRGSDNDPRLVTLEHAPKEAKKTIAFVGKGITFDTGGISIKPSPKMGDMKFDMSGAAAVFGLMRAVAKLKLPIRVIGVLGLAENMPGSRAYKPGDVVTTKSGKTIEVDNTDAEGRIVLADALHHAAQMKPDMMVDLATLTGAVIVCFGDVAAGVMVNDEGVLKKLKTASEKSGERIWELPMWEAFDRDIESKIADVKNVGMPRMSGTIAAAKLLQEFVNDVPWAHLDIAGVAWADARDNYFTRSGAGGTGFGIRLLVEMLRRLDVK